MVAPVLSSSVRNSLLSLGKNRLLLELAQQRLATGLRVDSAIDSPSAYFTASSLSARAGALNRLLGGMALAQRTIEAAHSGAEAIERLLQLAKNRMNGALRAPEGAVVPGTASATGAFTIVSDSAATLTGANMLPADTAATAVSPVSIAADDAAVLTGLNGIAADTTASVTAANPIAADTATATGTQNIAGDDAAEITGTGAALAPDQAAQVSSTGINWGLNGVLLALGRLLGQSITVNGEMFNFGLFSTGQDLQQFIDGIDGLSAVVAGGQIVVTGDGADTAIDISFSSALVGALTGLSEEVEQPVNLLTQGAIAQGETLSIQIGVNPHLAVIFGSDDGAGEISTLEELDDLLGALTGGTASLDPGNGNISIQAAAATDDIVIGGTATLANFGITAGIVEPSNATLGALAGSLTFSYGGEDDTITFGADDGADQVSTRAELEAWLAVLTLGGGTGLAFSINGSARLVVTTSDPSGDITVTGDGAALAALGFSADQTANLENASLGALGGDLTFSFGGQTDTVAFGTGEVDTRAELAARLADISLNGDTGAAFSLDGSNRITVTAPDGGGDVVIDGDTAVLAVTGFSPGQVAEPENTSIGPLSGAIAFSFGGADDTLAFGADDGAGEVNTRTELEERLSALASGGNTGAAFELDAFGRLQVTAPDAGGSLAVSGDAAVLTALGLSPGQTASPTNGTLDALSGVLTFSFAGETDTIAFGPDGGGSEVDTRAELAARLADLSLNGDTGVTFALDASNRITAAAPDASGDIVIDGDAGVLAATGYSSGQTATPGNAALGGLAGDLVFTYGGQSDIIVFGTGDCEVGTLAGLAARLADLTANGNTGLSFSLYGSGHLALTAPDAGGNITVTGAAGALAAAGFDTGQTGEPTNATFAALAAANDTLVIGTGAASDTLVFGADSRAGEISTLAELQAVIAGVLPDTGVALSLKGGYFLHAAGPPGKDLSFGGSNGGAAAAVLGLPAVAPAPEPIVQQNAERAALQENYNALLAQIDAVARDSGYSGVNLLQQGTLSIVLNETGTGILNVDGVEFDSEGLGLQTVSDNTFQTDAGLNPVLDDVEGAIRRLRNQRMHFQTDLTTVEVRRRFNRHLAAILETGASALTVADMNEEGAMLLALQLRGELAARMLPLAASADTQFIRRIL